GVTGYRREVDRPVEWNGEARLEVEPVERVDDSQILAIRRPSRAVGHGHIDSPPWVLTAIRYREPITGKRPGGWRRKIEERVNPARPRRGGSSKRPGIGARKQQERERNDPGKCAAAGWTHGKLLVTVS